MKNTRTYLAATILTLTIFALTGCDQMAMNSPFQQQQPTAGRQPSDVDYVNDTSIVGSDKNSGRGATEAALEWSDKYAKSAQELLYANKRITELEAEKKELSTNLAKLKVDVESYKNELNDANLMLNEMKKDLKEWQANVLGYRNQMMSAQSAQLAALQKILELLGGEVATNEFHITEDEQIKASAQ